MRYIVALVRLDDMYQAHRELDAAAIQLYVAQIRTSMDRVRNVKTRLTATITRLATFGAMWTRFAQRY